MTHRELITYCQQNGIEHKLISRGDFEVLRIMDLSQLPSAMRQYFDVETGVYNKPLVAEVEKSPDEIPVTEPLAAEAEEIKEEGANELPDEPKEPEESGAESFADAGELKGKLPDSFPGHTALDAAGIHTYGQLRKVKELTEIPGIGDATAAKIQEELG